MAKTTRKKKAASRQPSSGSGTPLMVRVQPPMLKALDRWVGNTGITRPEAIRQILEHTLRKHL